MKTNLKAKWYKKKTQLWNFVAIPTKTLYIRVDDDENDNKDNVREEEEEKEKELYKKKIRKGNYYFLCETIRWCSYIKNNKNTWTQYLIFIISI